MFLMIFLPSEGRWVSMNLFEIISFTADLVGLLSDLNEFLPSDDSNANGGIVFFGFLRNKKEKP